MKFNEHIEEVLRKWYFWAIAIPLIIILVTSLIGRSFIPFEIILLGFILFPYYILQELLWFIDIRNITSNIPRIFGYAYLLVIYGLYILFIIKVKKLNKKILYWLTIIILVLIALGLKGCTYALSHAW